MTPKTEITAGLVRSLFDYEPETGVLTWRRRDDVGKTWNTRFAGKPAGTVGQNGYLQVVVNYRQMRAHQVIWALMTGQWPSQNIDHVDGDPANNRWSNLRLATVAQNAHNSKRPRNNKTGYKGVSVCSRTGKFVAQIALNRKVHTVGRFETVDEAAQAYRDAAKRLHGEFARFE